MIANIVAILMALWIAPPISNSTKYQTQGLEQGVYLVSGFPTETSGFGKESALYLVNARARRLDKVRDLVGQDGTNLIVSNQDHRILVLATPHDQPRNFSVVDMDQPEKALSFPVDYGERFLVTTQSHLACLPDGSVYMAMSVGRDGPAQLLGLSLKGAELAGRVRDLSWSDLANPCLEGHYGGAKYGQDTQVAFSKNNRLVIYRPYPNAVDLGLPMPPDERLEDEEAIGVVANTKSLVAFYRAKESAVGSPDNPGSLLLHVYNKTLKVWREARFAGGLSGFRAFGPWLAGFEAETKRLPKGPSSTNGGEKAERESPGSASRQLRLAGDEQDSYTVDQVFRESRAYFPGTLYLYDTRSGTQFRIQTGQGDSEVLLIDHDTAYYRVNNTLYQTAIGKNGIGSPEVVLSDANLPLVHWAFSGPVPGSQ